MINLSSVTKTFGEKKAVEKISFKAKKGEIIGFLGPNGAGKTTTMRLILGYLKPTQGEILVDNHNPIEDRVAVVKKVGYLAENNPLYPEMKVREYLQFIASVKKDDNWEKIAEAVGLAEVLGKKIEELSRGYKQRVGLAAALLGDPKILILDEPTSGLDPLEQEKMRVLIKKLGKEKTIIFSTHILSEVEDVASRLIIINQGKIVYDGVKPKGKGAVEKLFKKVVKN
jgi:ABC-2 type transport system ATP-binding protein